MTNRKAPAASVVVDGAPIPPTGQRHGDALAATAFVLS